MKTIEMINKLERVNPLQKQTSKLQSSKKCSMFHQSQLFQLQTHVMSSLFETLTII